MGGADFMYLLMLLATFMASIYGYNLSARPDYDRDIARKKAAAVVFKFTIQHNAIRKILIDISIGGYKAADGADIPWSLPGDVFYADFDAPNVQDNEDIHLFIKQDGNDEHLIYLRAKNNRNQLNPDGRDYLMAGRQVYDGSEMATKIICVDKALNETDSKYCVSSADADGNITDSCCNMKGLGGRYIISYKQLDARWVNRITGDVSLDFVQAINKKLYYDNIGVIRWRRPIGGTKEAWQFKGKINFLPVYADDLEKWNQEHNNAVNYPVEHRNRSEWTLPDWIFKQDFFEGKNGDLICDANRPCLFKIQSF